MATLSSYLTAVRRLLHDANANFYTDQQLTDNINSARERVVRDTGALREIVVAQVPCQVAPSATINSVAPAYPTPWLADTAVTDGTATLQYVGNCENISYEALTNLMGTAPLSQSSGNTILDIVNINLYWGNSRLPMNYFAWSDFSARLRFWQNYIGQPLAFSVYGQSNIYIGPVPDQIYQVEIDCVVLPNPLNLSTPTINDSINDPYSAAVPFYSAYLAKFYEQSFGESEIFKQEYLKQINSIINSVYTRRLPSIYSSPY